jgi:hypothetical protein
MGVQLEQGQVPVSEVGSLHVTSCLQPGAGRAGAFSDAAGMTAYLCADLQLHAHSSTAIFNHACIANRRQHHCQDLVQ